MTRSEKLLLSLVVVCTLIVLFVLAFPISIVTRNAAIFRAEEAVGQLAAVLALMCALALAFVLVTKKTKK